MRAIILSRSNVVENLSVFLALLPGVDTMTVTGPLGENLVPPVVFQPDGLVTEHLLDLMIQDKVSKDLLQIVVTDLRTRQQQIILVGWEGGNLSHLAYKLYDMLNEGNEDSGLMETFFWLFWRGWAGNLDVSILQGLPVVDDSLLQKVDAEEPLRGAELRQLKTAIMWAFANESAPWGDRDMWKTGQLSPGHLQMRNALSKYIDRRMQLLHGKDYENVPAD